MRALHKKYLSLASSKHVYIPIWMAQLPPYSLALTVLMRGPVSAALLRRPQGRQRKHPPWLSRLPQLLAHQVKEANASEGGFPEHAKAIIKDGWKEGVDAIRHICCTARGSR